MNSESCSFFKSFWKGPHQQLAAVCFEWYFNCRYLLNLPNRYYELKCDVARWNIRYLSQTLEYRVYRLTKLYGGPPKQTTLRYSYLISGMFCPQFIYIKKKFELPWVTLGFFVFFLPVEMRALL